MSSETTQAFEHPSARAEASNGAAHPDRISVRDYICDVEIGAFQAERGVRQRIRFNVVLEVNHTDAAQSDDVDQVISYDAITEAIETLLSTERINLLETLAERVAERLLADPRTQRVFIRIEKLDRIPGALGVEIVRDARSYPQSDRRKAVVAAKADIPHPLVVFMPNTLLYSDDLAQWLEAIDHHELPAIICLEQAPQSLPKATNALANRRIGLLSIEQNAWVLAGRDKRCVVVNSRTELDWAMKHGQLSVWAPSKIVLDAVKSPQASGDDPLKLAQWFAAEFSADHISILGEFAGATNSSKMQMVHLPGQL